MPLDGLRLAISTLTVFPVKATRADRDVAAQAMVLAPIVGLAVGAVALAVLLLMNWLAGALVAATATIAAIALVTRGLHLDGLADLADGLGSRAPAPQALEIMRRSDIGPFGVVTLLLVVLTQVAALATATGAGRGVPAVLVACVTARLAITWGCITAIPAARSEGLGAMVAGTVRLRQAAAATGVIVVGFALLGAVFGNGLPDAIRYGCAVIAGLAAGYTALFQAVRRLRGITGDVLGAVAELAATAALIVTAIR